MPAPAARALSSQVQNSRSTCVVGGPGSSPTMCQAVQARPALPPPASHHPAQPPQQRPTLRRGHLLAAPALELLAAARRQVRACALLAWLLPVAGEALVVWGAATLHMRMRKGEGGNTHTHPTKACRLNTHQQVCKHTRPAGASLPVVVLLLTSCSSSSGPAGG